MNFPPLLLLGRRRGRGMRRLAVTMYWHSESGFLIDDNPFHEAGKLLSLAHLLIPLPLLLLRGGEGELECKATLASFDGEKKFPTGVIF
jgi:hypothetical protein